LPEAVDDAPFQPRYSHEFRRLFGRQKQRENRQQIINTVVRICRNPAHKSPLLQNKSGTDWRGKRHRHARGDLIVIFAWCRECREQRFHAGGLNSCCEDPGRTPANVIHFLTLGTHKDLFRWR